MKLTKDKIRQEIIKAGVKNLRAFGYPDVNASNILTVYIFRQFFLSMLHDEENATDNKDITQVTKELIAEIEAIDAGTA